MTLHRLLPVLGLLLLALPSSADARKAGTSHTAWISSNHIQVIDLDEGRVIGRIPLQEYIHDMVFSPDGSTVYVGSSKGLRVADATALEFTQRIDGGPTHALSISQDGSRLAVIHRAEQEASRAARSAGLPLPPSKVVVYATNGMTPEVSFPVAGGAYDLVLLAGGPTVLVLVPQDGAVHEYRLDGTLVRTLPIVNQDGPNPAMLSGMELSPDQSSLVVPATDREASWLAELDLTGKRDPAEQLVKQELGHARRIQGISWDEDGSGVYVTAVRSMVKFNGRGLPVAWQGYPQNYVDVKPIPSSDESVMIAPTFNKKRGSGGLSVIDSKGQVLRSVELPDISPFVLIVQP